MITEAVHDGPMDRIMSDPHRAMSEAQHVALESAADKSERRLDAEAVEEPLRVRKRSFHFLQNLCSREPLEALTH